MAHNVVVNEVLSLTHDVKRIRTSKPKGYEFTPGQATEVSLNKQGFEDEKRPFTFTSLPSEDHLEFVIKSYFDHDGVTKQIDAIREGDELLIDDAWGAIEYKGKGIFIAGGAGITPFISIFRDLYEHGKIGDNKLIYSNKTGKDVILEPFWQEILGENFTSTLTREKIEGHDHGRITMDYLGDRIDDFSQHFYVCGPDEMVKNITGLLKQLGASPEGLVFEE
ncbi:FAD-binding oxidoreductase [Marinoscillum sp.]|uniref:FAD-binding oxidoreductase n=1 Tax=Marinoscillum sp. TaxID=2024838 RepID=UPI003BABB4FD